MNNKILSFFCETDMSLNPLYKEPFSIDEWAYSTNNQIIVRTKNKVSDNVKPLSTTSSMYYSLQAVFIGVDFQEKEDVFDLEELEAVFQTIDDDYKTVYPSDDKQIVCFKNIGFRASILYILFQAAQAAGAKRIMWCKKHESTNNAFCFKTSDKVIYQLLIHPYY
jgi:hypothetical protein